MALISSSFFCLRSLFSGSFKFKLYFESERDWGEEGGGTKRRNGKLLGNCGDRTDSWCKCNHILQLLTHNNITIKPFMRIILMWKVFFSVGRAL